MPLQRIKLNSGIVRNATNLANEGGWWHSDKVRFWYGLPQKLGGWIKLINLKFKGIARLIITWNAFAPDNELVGLGTSDRFYIITTGQAYDITPIASTATLVGATPLVTRVQENRIYVTHANHGFQNYQSITVSGATAIGGIPAGEINGTHNIRIIDALSYMFMTTTAASSAAVGGAGVNVSAFIYAGPDVAVVEGGWGAPPWGGQVGALDTISGETDDVGWGASYSAERLTQQPGLWSADVFGNDLFINPRGQPIYYWQYANGGGLNTPAVELSTLATTAEKPWVPREVNYIVTNDLYNFLLAYGVNLDNTVAGQDPLFIRWSDQNNFFDWEPRADNQAGGIRLSSGSMILAAMKTRQETLIFTDTAVYVQQYIGPPLVFSFSLVSNNISMLGPNAGMVFNGTAYWMGAGRFYKYDGTVQPLVCPLSNMVFDDLDINQAWQVYCGYNEHYREVYWFYCSMSTANRHPDRYVIYNTFFDDWVYGTMDRSAWQFSPFRSLPIAAKPLPYVDEWGDKHFDTTMLLHEVGNDDASGTTPQPITAFIESSDFDIAEGHSFAFVSKVIPDVDFMKSDAVNPAGRLGVDVRNQPGSKYRDPEELGVRRTAAKPVELYTEQLNFRLRGRQVKLWFESDELGVAWKFGPPRFDIRQDGRR